MKLFTFVLAILSISFMTCKYNEIEYRQRIVSKYDKSFTSFSIVFKRERGIRANYEKGKLEYEIDPETMSLKEKVTSNQFKSFRLSNEELGLMESKELFKNFDKIEFPEETDFTTALYPDFPIWHIIVDGKDYKSNVDTDFSRKLDDLINIRKIKEYVINKCEK